MVFGQEHVPDTEFFGAVFHRFEDGGVADPAAGLGLELRGVDGVGGDAFFLDPVFDLEREMALDAGC